ncbi:MAG: hypothetical protein IJ558_03595 [Treponema sp.]|nr:hypothetical protein [Treponema sp.]
MKKIFFVCALVASCFFFMACPDSSDSGSQPTSDEKKDESKEKKDSETITKNESDWLFLFYFDADNNLNDDIYTNMRQAEYSLSLLRNEDGSAKDGCPTVNMVALWDGESRSDAREYENRYVHSLAALYELGADFNLDYEIIDETFGIGYVYDKTKFDPNDAGSIESWEAFPAFFGESFTVGANTKELSLKDASIQNEPDMGSVTTLTKFLSWAKKHYVAKNVVLCLCDHGAGTGKEQYTDTTSSSRTLCADDSAANSERMLSTKNIKDALESAGYTGSDALSLLWMDVCLQSSVEIAYDLRGVASYLVASPNLSVSHEYSHAFQNLTAESSAEDFGKMLVSEYYHLNYNEPMAYDSDSPLSSGCSMYTMSLLSLSESNLDSLKTAIDDLADALLSLTEKDDEAFCRVYTTLLAQSQTDFSQCAGLTYAGSYVMLSDIGYFTDGILSQFSDYTDLCTAAQTVQAALESVIVYAYGGMRGESIETVLEDGDDEDDEWGWSSFSTPEWTSVSDTMYLTAKNDYLTDDSVSTVLTAPHYGLTIETQNVQSEASLILMMTMYIYQFTGEEPKSTTYEELCEELRNALLASHEFSALDAAYMVAYFKQQLEEADYVTHYLDYTGFSEKWAEVITLWYSYSS